MSNSTTEELLTPREVVQQGTHEQNLELMQEVTYEEVKTALFSMHPEKSPGIDGFNPGFFQAFWKVVGSDVTEFCQKFFLSQVKCRWK